MNGSLFQQGNPRLILASSSLYRRDLLARLRLPFDVMAPEVPEHPYPGEAPAATAIRLAVQKANVVARTAPGTLVIGSDQVAQLHGEAIGKPGSHANALLQLQKMRAQTVVFHTAVCLIDGRDAARNNGFSQQQVIVDTVVRFRDLPDEALDTYLKIEQPYDCAGSAKNEGLGIALIDSCSAGDPTALIGLPLIALCSMLANVGVVFFATNSV